MLRNTLRSTLRKGFDTVRAANTGDTPVRDGRLNTATQGSAYSATRTCRGSKGRSIASLRIGARLQENRRILGADRRG